MRQTRALLLLAVVTGCSSRATTDPPLAPEPGPPSSPSDAAAEPPSPEAVTSARLFTWLQGTFDSKDQAKTDPTYFAISLTTCNVDLPAMGTQVMYIEQSKVGSAPYRQRLYVVESIDATAARSRVFEPSDASALVGLCTASPRPKLEAKDFVERTGCSVEMHWTGDHFEGHTPNARWTGTEFVDDAAGVRCPSELNGAAFASSEVTLQRDRMKSWDRGFDAKGEQVWGATKGGYVFVRRTPPPAP
ncbi:chromophore lyase CpcT/CpeT [soil metagenome]